MAAIAGPVTTRVLVGYRYRNAVGDTCTVAKLIRPDANGQLLVDGAKVGYVGEVYDNVEQDNLEEV